MKTTNNKLWFFASFYIIFQVRFATLTKMKTRFFLILIICLFLVNCEPKKRNWDKRQKALSFSFTDSNTLFKLYPKDSINFYTYQDKLITFDSMGIRKSKKYVILTYNELDIEPKYFIGIGDIAEYSSIFNIKTYYINWPNGDCDTLFADYIRETGDQDKNNCKCSDPMVSLKYNGKSYIRKTNYDINGIYIFDK